jgi:ribosomal protein S18 acetylase RimI-like enzyme
MNIRKARKGDVKQIAKLIMEGFAKYPYNTKYSLKEAIHSVNLEMEKGETYIIEETDKIIGFISISKEHLDMIYIFIENLVVDNNYQRKGIGRRLLNFIEKRYRNKNATITLSTNKKSNAYKFYKSMGYKENKIHVNMSKKL